MGNKRRVFIFGAGFSKPAGMPLATGLLELLIQKLAYLDEMKQWLESLTQRLEWLSRNRHKQSRSVLSIEELFHRAHFDIEVHRLRQHLARVGRKDGPGTPWKAAESISAWLSYMEEKLRDVILDSQAECNMAPILRWASAVHPEDAVLTFNYDTLVEDALRQRGEPWTHGFLLEGKGIPVYKLHGSIDWVVAHREDPNPKSRGYVLLFDKQNLNRPEGSGRDKGDEDLLPDAEPPMVVEDDCRLWRVGPGEQLQKWMRDRLLQVTPHGACELAVGIAGLGAYKELHRIPGLGETWFHAMNALMEADSVIVVGFSMSDFDAMAQMQFAQIAQARSQKGCPLQVHVINPCMDNSDQDRFRNVFDKVEFTGKCHESIDWSTLA